jgi:hypothetical protein
MPQLDEPDAPPPHEPAPRTGRHRYGDGDALCCSVTIAFFGSSVDMIMALAPPWQIAVASSFSVIEMCHTGRFNVSIVSDRIAYIAVRSSSIGLGRCW